MKILKDWQGQLIQNVVHEQRNPFLTIWCVCEDYILNIVACRLKAGISESERPLLDNGSVIMFPVSLFR
jgi:hypothetical protein